MTIVCNNGKCKNAEVCSYESFPSNTSWRCVLPSRADVLGGHAATEGDVQR